MPPKKQTPTAVEQPPDAFGKAGRVLVVVRALSAVQAQLAVLEVAQVEHELADDDCAPGYTMTEAGPSKTVEQERDELTAREGRIVKKYEKLMPEVRAHIEASAPAQA